MTKKNWVLIGVVLLLGGIYAFYFTKWFQREAIQIAPSRRPLPRNSKAESYPVGFGLDQKYKLTSVKVIPLVNREFNKFTPPAWHLVTRSNSVPIKGFLYGQAIKGMEPANPKFRAEPLMPHRTYRLFVEAGQMKGEQDFTAPAVIREASPP